MVLKNSTIKRHLSNIDFYINDFLLYEEPLAIDYGIGRIDSFLGDFFIRKCMWSTPGNIKNTAASIKKFYKCMMDREIVNKAVWLVKANKRRWEHEAFGFCTSKQIVPIAKMKNIFAQTKK